MYIGRLNIRYYLSLIFFPLLFLIFSNPVYSYTTGMDASLVLGQPDFISNAVNRGGSPAANTLAKPKGIGVIGSKFIIADEGNNRILIYNSIPESDGESADVVVGQADMAGSLANRGGVAAANTLNQPYGVTTDGTKLVISDMGNNRVLVYNSVPLVNGADADVVIGQSDMSGDASDTSQTGLTGPMGVHYDVSSGKLIITDSANNRVLIYNGIPSSNGQSASVVVGQSDFEEWLPDTTASTLFLPTDARIFGNRLFVADTSNFRVLIYNSIPTANGIDADVVIGQTDMFSNDSGPTASSIDQPTAVHYDGSRLFLSDWDSRILIYNSIPSTNGVSADYVLGQSNFTSDTPNAGGIGPNTLNGNTLGLVHSENSLFAADTENNRILRYDDPGYVVSSLPAEISMVLVSDPTTSVDTTQILGEQTVRLMNGTIPVSDVVIDFSQNRDWSSVVAETDITLLKSVISISGANTGITGTHTLYVPKSASNALRICPEADSLAQVNTLCSGGVNFTGPFPQTQSVNSDIITVSETMINGASYYKISGLSGSGAIAYQNDTRITASDSTDHNRSGEPPICASFTPNETPDLFQIRTTKKSAKIFFTPVKDNITDYVVAYGFSPGDLKYSFSFPASDWKGVRSVDINLLPSNKTFYVQVRAGNGCASGEWSTPLKFKTDSKTYHKYTKK